MADGVFNIAKGRVAELYNRVDTNDGTNSALIVVLLKAAQADATLEDYDEMDALLTNAGNTEAVFTNYARKTLTDTELAAFAPDDTNNRVDLDFPDQTWTSAGGAANDTLVKLIVCYDPDTTAGTDTTLVPLTHHDFAVTTDGNDLTAQLATAGFYRAS